LALICARTTREPACKIGTVLRISALKLRTQSRESRKGDPRKMSILVRNFTSSLVISALLTQVCYAQEFPMSDRQKAEIAKKKADEKSTDEAYKAMIKRNQGVTQKADPWGGLRTPSTNGSK
jgi:hypothetical protein